MAACTEKKPELRVPGVFGARRLEQGRGIIEATCLEQAHSVGIPVWRHE